MRFEICVDSTEAVRAAHEAGADRVELCSALVEGGLTPTVGAIRLAKAFSELRVHVMIRPRGGDFLYSDDEIEQMLLDIAVAKAEGAHAVVFGLLLPDGTIDVEKTKRLIDAARPMQVTFHRAFDLAADPVASLEALADLHVERVLTSGQEENAMKGLPLICDLIRRADGRIIVMPGGGITVGNARLIARQSGCREMHFAALQPSESAMKFRRFNIPMGAPLGGKLGEYARTTTNRTAIRAVMDRAQS